MAEDAKNSYGSQLAKRRKQVEEFKKHEFHGNELGTPVIYVQYKGTYDMDGLYKLIAGFFRHQKFRFYELQQRHRHPGPFGVERQHRFRADRDIDTYHRWQVDITIETFDEHDVEVQQPDGSKRKMTKGRIWVQLGGKVILDYEKNWEKSYFGLHLRKFYNKYVISKRIQFVYWDKFYYSIIIRLHGKIQEFLGMESRGEEHRYGAGVH